MSDVILVRRTTSSAVREFLMPMTVNDTKNTGASSVISKRTNSSQLDNLGRVGAQIAVYLAGFGVIESTTFGTPESRTFTVRLHDKGDKMNNGIWDKIQSEIINFLIGVAGVSEAQEDSTVPASIVRQQFANVDPNAQKLLLDELTAGLDH